MLAASRKHQVLTQHLLCHLSDLVDCVADVDAFLKAILSEDTLGACEALDLSLYHKLVLIVGAKLSADSKSFFGAEGHGSSWYGDHVLVDELGRLVLVKVDFPLTHWYELLSGFFLQG